MKIGLVGPSYQERSLPFDAQRTVNFYPVYDEMGKEVVSLYATPGLTDFATAGSGPIRGAYYTTNGRAFVVSGPTLYEIDSAGTATSRGTLNSSSGIITMTDNGIQLGICDSEDAYTLVFSSNAFAQVTDGDFPSSVGMITFLDGYFIVNQNATGKFYISSLYDGTAWAALDFATAESSPDVLKGVYNAVGQLWLMGEFTSEIWTNTGDSVFPFERISGAKMEVGILAPHTGVAIDNSLIWVGQTKTGKGIVYRADGFSPVPISTSPIEKIIQDVSSPQNMRAYAYQEDGHTFYVLTGGGLETTLVYDFSTNLWHERAAIGIDGAFEQHIGICAMFAFNKQLVGDRRNGKIYEMSLDYASDAGDEIARERTFTHFSNEMKRQRISFLRLGFEMGLGTSDESVCLLYTSRDGGKTYSDPRIKGLGKVGEYDKKVVYRRLGYSEQLTFKIRVVSTRRVAITGAYLE